MVGQLGVQLIPWAWSFLLDSLFQVLWSRHCFWTYFPKSSFTLSFPQILTSNLVCSHSQQAAQGRRSFHQSLRDESWMLWKKSRPHGKQVQGISNVQKPAGSSRHDGCKQGMERSRNYEPGPVWYDIGEQWWLQTLPRFGSQDPVGEGHNANESVFDLVSFQTAAFCKSLPTLGLCLAGCPAGSQRRGTHSALAGCSRADGTVTS